MRRLRDPPDQLGAEAETARWNTHVVASERSRRKGCMTLQKLLLRMLFVPIQVEGLMPVLRRRWAAEKDGRGALHRRVD